MTLIRYDLGLKVPWIKFWDAETYVDDHGMERSLTPFPWKRAWSLDIKPGVRYRVDNTDDEGWRFKRFGLDVDTKVPYYVSKPFRTAIVALLAAEAHMGSVTYA